MSDPREALRVVHVCAPAAFGGLERVVQGLSTGLAAHGHEVTVVAVVEPGDDIRAFLAPIEAGGVTTVTLELSSRAYLQEMRLVRRLIDGAKPDVLHTHGHRPDLLHPAAARRRGVATVTTLHGFSKLGGLYDLLEWWQRRSLRQFDGVIAVSPALERTLREHGVAEGRLHLVQNAWARPESMLDRAEARKELGLPDECGRVIGWLGRLVEIKGPDVFVDALALVEEADWTACVMGEGPDLVALEARVAEKGLGDRVRFNGVVHDAPRLLAALDLFVLSSRSEGTPMALLEAMGTGVPVVTTQVGGVPHVVDAPRGGWVVPPESPEALATAIDHALGEPREAAARAAVGRERIGRMFGVDEWVGRHEEVYRSAMAARECTGR